MIKEFGRDFGAKGDASSWRIGTDGDPNERSTTEKIIVRGMLIIRACVKMVHNPAHTFRYRQPQDKEERNQATEMIRQQLLTEDFVRDVVDTIVSRYFVFRERDLREWEEEPEEWEKREDGDGDDWEFSIRPCSEKLFLDLAINYKDTIVGPLLTVFSSVANPDNEDVLWKDSVYSAIGLAAPVVRDHLDFDAFIRDVSIPEMRKERPGYNILRRRMAILLGQWISVKVGESSKPLVYQTFQLLLTKEGQKYNDQVVRVTAGRQFKHIVDDWDFDADRFSPYAPDILTSIMHLIEES